MWGHLVPTKLYMHNTHIHTALCQPGAGSLAGELIFMLKGTGALNQNPHRHEKYITHKHAHPELSKSTHTHFDCCKGCNMKHCTSSLVDFIYKNENLVSIKILGCDSYTSAWNLDKENSGLHLGLNKDVGFPR